MRVLDVQDDRGASFGAFLEHLGVEPENLEFLKTASVVDPHEARDRDFALLLVDDDGSVHRKYACSDKGNITCSMFYLERAQPFLNTAAIKTAAANLASLARDFGMNVPVEIEKMASLELTPDDTRDILDERTVVYHPPRQFAPAPVPDTTPFGKIASAQRQWHDLSPLEKRATALEIVEESRGLPLTVPEHIFKYAGTTLSPNFSVHMRRRMEYTADREVADQYEFLSKTAALYTPESVLDAVYKLDDAAGLRWSGGDRYGERLPDPVLCVYGQTKEAAYRWQSGGDFVTEHDLVRFVPREDARMKFTDIFTDDVWLRFVKDPVGTFKGMPDEQKMLLSRLARAE